MDEEQLGSLKRDRRIAKAAVGFCVGYMILVVSFYFMPPPWLALTPFRTILIWVAFAASVFCGASATRFLAVTRR